MWPWISFIFVAQCGVWVGVCSRPKFILLYSIFIVTYEHIVNRFGTYHVDLLCDRFREGNWEINGMYIMISTCTRLWGLTQCEIFSIPLLSSEFKTHEWAIKFLNNFYIFRPNTLHPCIITRHFNMVPLPFQKDEEQWSHDHYHFVHYIYIDL